MLKIIKSPNARGVYMSRLGVAINLSLHWDLIWRDKPVPRFGKVRQIGPIAVWIGYDPNAALSATRIDV
jgi:hypothetical protein